MLWGAGQEVLAEALCTSEIDCHIRSYAQLPAKMWLATAPTVRSGPNRIRYQLSRTLPLPSFLVATLERNSISLIANGDDGSAF